MSPLSTGKNERGNADCKIGNDYVADSKDKKLTENVTTVLPSKPCD